MLSTQNNITLLCLRCLGARVCLEMSNHLDLDLQPFVDVNGRLGRPVPAPNCHSPEGLVARQQHPLADGKKTTDAGSLSNHVEPVRPLDRREVDFILCKRMGSFGYFPGSLV